MTALQAVGVHVPRYRVAAEELEAAWDGIEASGLSSKAVPGPDEDSLTMGVEAGESAIRRADVERSSIEMLALGTTTPPLETFDVAAQAVEMLGLPGRAETAVHSQSTRAGVRALRTAAASGKRPALVIASDSPVGEPDDAIGQAAGAGAVAFVLGEEGGATIEGWGSASQEFPGTRYRVPGEAVQQSYGATAYERRAYEETIAGAVEDLERGTAVSFEDLEDLALAPTAPDGRLPYRAGNRLDLDSTIYERAVSLGDTGAASPFFGLLEAWAGGEDLVLVVGYADGAAADAVLIRGVLHVEEPGETVDLSASEYLRLSGQLHSNGGEP